MADDDRGGVRPDLHDDRRTPARGCLHLLSLDGLIEGLVADVLEGLELRLAFEAWADQR